MFLKKLAQLYCRKRKEDLVWSLPPVSQQLCAKKKDFDDLPFSITEKLFFSNYWVGNVVCIAYEVQTFAHRTFGAVDCVFSVSVSFVHFTVKAIITV